MLPPFILFDLDDTLFDHTHASRCALAAVHAAHAPEAAFEIFAAEHARLLEVFHQRFLAGEYTLDQARAARMTGLFATLGRALSADEAAHIGAHYRREHQANRQLIAGARDLLDALLPHARLGLITNNSTADQIDKLRTLDIARYFDSIVISEDVGVAKPDPRIFALALERLGAHAHEAVMIGDSLHADIEGARAAGMATVWLNLSRDKSLLSTVISEQKHVETPVDIGLSKNNLITLASLAPVESALNAIRLAHAGRGDGETKLNAANSGAHSQATKEGNNAKLETLAS
jgi:HAD superfamily hydrolase (TIGR01549 family)